jgi:hypothetical protein
MRRRSAPWVLLQERHAITQAQYDKSLRDLTEKMDN